MKPIFFLFLFLIMYKSNAQEHYLEWYINPSSEYESVTIGIPCQYYSLDHSCTQNRNTIFVFSKGIRHKVTDIINGNPTLEKYEITPCSGANKRGSQDITIGSFAYDANPSIRAITIFQGNNGLYGVQDENCQALIEPIFEDITNFSITSDLFFVKYQNKWGAIKNPFKQLQQLNPAKSFKRNGAIVDYMPDEKHILVSGNTFEILNIETGESKYKIHTDYKVHYSSNKKYLVFTKQVLQREEIKIINLTNFKLEKILSVKKSCNKIRVSDDGKYVFLVENDGIYVLEAETEKLNLIVAFNKKYVNPPDIDIQPYQIDDQSYISTLQDNIWRLWNAKTKKLIREKNFNSDYSRKALLKHKLALISYQSKTGEYKLFDLMSDTEISLNTDDFRYNDNEYWDNHHSNRNRWCHFSNENYIACGNRRNSGNIVRIWNIKNGALIKSIKVNSYGIPNMSLTSDNQFLLIPNGEVSIWNLNPTRKPIWKLSPIINPIPQALANINFIHPALSYTTISTNSIQIRACVRSQTPVTKTILYIDGAPYKNRDWDIVPSNDCQVVINQSISLQSGTHRLKITATNEAGTVTSEEKIIEVQENQPKPIITSNNYALLIAVQDYTDPNINSLNKPIQDAESLQEVLVSKYGFSSSQVNLLRNPTKSEIIDAFIRLRNLSSNDNLLIYYGGHGKMDGDMGFWLPSNATKKSHGNWLSNADVIGYISSIPSKHTLALVDACFGGSLIMRELGDEQACEIQGSLTSRQAMTSGTKAVVPDESVFMRYLIKKLNENTEDCLAADKLFHLLKTPVVNNSPIKQVPLMSPIPSTGDEGGSFIFRLKY